MLFRSQTAKALGGGKKSKGGKLDPVGKEDGDVNNDGKKDKTDSYLMNRRKAIGKAMAKEEVEQLDELSSDTLKSYIKKRREKIARGKQGLDRAIDQTVEKDTIGRTVKKPKGTYDIKNYKGKKGTVEYQKDKDKNQNEEFLADGTTSTEPSGKKINPKNVDNYKSGAVQIAPVDEADPQNGYGVKEEVEKKDNRANYAYINFMKNKLRAGMGIKNPMIMVDPDKAKEKFEKMATSITASTGEDEKEDACEQLDKKINIPGFNNKGRGGNTGNIKVEPKALQLYRHVRDVGNTVAGGVQAFGTLGRNMSLLKTQDARAEKLRRNPKGIERVATGIADKLTGDKYDFDKKGPSKKISTMNSSYDPIANSDIIKIAEKIGLKPTLDNKVKTTIPTSTNIPTESNPGGGVRNPNDETSYPSGAEIKTGDTPSEQNALPPKVKVDYKGKFGDNKMNEKPNRGNIPSKPVPPRRLENSYNPLLNNEILGISEKILKKNFNLGEEGYDVARDEGRVKPSKDKKDATSYPPSEEMKRTQKKNKGPSAYEIVKKKYGKAVMDVDKKKKDKK